MEKTPHTSLSGKRNPARFWLKALLWSSPLLVLLALDNLLLPIGTFCFRSWESLAVNKNFLHLPGPFYPGKTLQRVETGDEGHGTEYAVEREVDWHTDARGYRNRRPETDSAEIVIVGDSMAVGSGLTQADTLGEMLERATGMRTYTFAPANMNTAVRALDRQFTRLPRFLVLEVIERYVPLLRSADPAFFGKMPRYRPSPPRSPVADAFFIRLDHLEKLAALRTTRSWFNRMAAAWVRFAFPQSASESFSISRLRMITDDKATNAPVPEEVIERCAQAVASYRPFLEARGIEMIFLPLPNKETIYWDYMEPAIEPTFLPRLIKRVRELGVTAIDVQAAMQAARKAAPDTILYQLDDTHWNAAGVAVTTAEFKKYFDSLPASVKNPGPDRTRRKSAD